MMTFEDFAYERPDLQVVTERLEELLGEFDQAKPGDLVGIVRAVKRLRARWTTQQSLCYVRHTADTSDTFYEAEQAYFDEVAPQFDALVHRFHEALAKSEHVGAVTEAFGPQYMRRVRASLRSFDPSTVASLGEENRLASSYTKLRAQASIPFRGQTYNLSSIQPLLIDRDRTTRREANEAVWSFYAEHEAELQELFAKLVAQRTDIARRQGRDNFVSLGYDRMSRTDYGPQEVAAFRAQVREHIVPLATELYRRQSERLGQDALEYHDEGLAWPQGNPKPRGNPEATVAAAADLYAELSKETEQFFAVMEERGLMDLVARDNKAPGGYCTYLPSFCVPFIFSNFNGTSGDIDVLTHELGHAFQMYEASRQPLLEYLMPTYEACEIPSMSMEFFAYPWMDKFFADEAERYRTNHLEMAVKYLPYITAIDEFQHLVYEQPDMTSEERLRAWLDLEAAYLPHRDYGSSASAGIDLLLERFDFSQRPKAQQFKVTPH